MARTRQGTQIGRYAWGLALAAACGLAAAQATAQQHPPSFTRECQPGNTMTATESPLPNVAAALQRRKKLKILGIGAASTPGMGNVHGG